jgi:hypothetical protein
MRLRPNLRTILALSVALTSSLMFAYGAIAQVHGTATGSTSMTVPPNDPVMSCDAYKSMEPPAPRKKRGPIKMVAKALGSELKTDSSDMLKDTIFVFSAKDVDPYDEAPPTNKPYTLMEIQYVDGSQASVVKYPDGSAKIVGGYADGTIIAPNGTNTYIVAYPNGVRGKLVKVSPLEYKVYRPDNTVTVIKKNMSGSYEISNSKSGYMGTADPDREGMQFEFNTKNY